MLAGSVRNETQTKAPAECRRLRACTAETSIAYPPTEGAGAGGAAGTGAGAGGAVTTGADTTGAAEAGPGVCVALASGGFAGIMSPAAGAVNSSCIMSLP